MSLRLLLPIVAVILASPAFAERLGFNKDIRPILSENCFACHGLDEGDRQADLRLDVPEAAYQKNDFGEAAIIPGNPEGSLVWQRIVSSDADEIMPPLDSHKQLDATEKAIIRRWIAEGAVYQKHWAFERPVKSTGEGIDHFIRESLSGRGLQPSPTADRPTLIRRVSMALTGLPPTIDEVDTFLNDRSDRAYERMVDRYLASQHFGEEMAVHWLDVARYGDTHGMHLDNERQTWAYRDWVVSAFNNNLPYDQFTIDQLAGDLIPNATQDQIVATGFNRCNVTTGEGGSIDKEWIFRYAVDRASTTAQAWLGLSAGCAVCHDHKYDPISQKEFYSLYAFFYSAADPAMDGNQLLTAPVMKVKPPEYEQTIKSFAERENAILAKMDLVADSIDYVDPADQDPLPTVEEVEDVWMDDAFPSGAQLLTSVTALTFSDQPSVSGKKSLKIQGPAMAQTFYEKGAQPQVVPVGGKFFLNVYLDPADPPEEIMIQFNTGAWKHRAIWGADLIDWGKQGSSERYPVGSLPNPGEWAKLEFDATLVGLEPGAKVMGFAFVVHGGTAYFDRMGVTGRIDPSADTRMSFTAWRRSQAGKDMPGAPSDINEWLRAGLEAVRTPAELSKLRGYYLENVCLTTRELFADLHGELEVIRKERSDYDDQVPSTFIFRDLPKPRESFVMLRGQYDTPGEKVEPGTPAILHELRSAGERANRLDLARWMVSPENPLTARVAVNRFWQQMFGTGLVETSHDFGTQGSLPTHPELLDWLAIWFQENGWDVKKLIRMIVTSETFRQQSQATKENWRVDPSNKWLSRGPRFRLSAEQVRDQALFVSGLIKLQMGGKGVNPYQPPNIWEPVGFGNSNTRYYKRGDGDDLYRRTIYTFIKRTAPHPLMDNFDMPSREDSCIRRDRTNTPLQALQLMNDVQHYEAARNFAARMIKAAPLAEDRIQFGYRTVLARLAQPDEISVIEKLLESQLARYQRTPQDAKKVITFGDSQAPSDIDPSELAAWTLVANLILNLDEAVMRN